jgi:hypothetical protein
MTTTLLLCFSLLVPPSGSIQKIRKSEVHFEVRFSKTMAVWQLLRNLAPKSPDNPFKNLYKGSEFDDEKHSRDIIAFNQIPLDYEYGFRDYPGKNSASVDEILERNLIYSRDLQEFKVRSLGILPATQLDGLISALNDFTPVYDKLVYQPNKTAFEKQLREIKALLVSHKVANVAGDFELASAFYRSPWDPSIPFIFVFYPLPNSERFTATAFANIALSAIPTSMTSFTGILSVMLHEASHILYDEQPASFKSELEGWFENNSSIYSHYAEAILNESLATAVGNGYFYARLNGSLNTRPWYGWKYYDEMARQMYPTVKQYLDDRKPIDREFVERYISAYEAKFSSWISEWDYLLSGRIVLATRQADLDLIQRKFPFSPEHTELTDFSVGSWKKVREHHGTKVIIISTDNRHTLDELKGYFPELEAWRPDVERDFTYEHLLPDRTCIIVINLVKSGLEQQLASKLHLQ